MKRTDKIKLLQAVRQGNKQAIKALSAVQVPMEMDWSKLEMDFGSGINGPDGFILGSSIPDDNKNNLSLDI